MNVPDLERLILSYAGVFYPVSALSRLSLSALANHTKVLRSLRSAWIQIWTPTFCNVLRWEKTHLKYRAVTQLTPRLKNWLAFTRSRYGFYPIYPGDRQYPTSRVRFHPAYNTNDRYFR